MFSVSLGHASVLVLKRAGGRIQVTESKSWVRSDKMEMQVVILTSSLVKFFRILSKKYVTSLTLSPYPERRSLECCMLKRSDLGCLGLAPDMLSVHVDLGGPSAVIPSLLL